MNHVLTPLQIGMLLHYYAIAAPYAKNEPEHADSPAVHRQRAQLVAWGLIEEHSDCDSGYRTTERGYAHVKTLCSLPLPVQRWVSPVEV